MKKQFKLWFAAAAVAAFTFSSCSKEETFTSAGSGGPQSTQEMMVLADQAENEFLNYGSAEDESYTGEYDSNEDGLPDAYQVTAGTADNLYSSKRDGRAAGIRLCLSGLGLDSAQIKDIRGIFAAYDTCKADVIARHIAALKQLITRRNAAMRDLIALRKADSITQKEFVSRVHSMNKRFKRARFELADKSKDALRACYTAMLRKLEGVLTDSQWNAFVDCYRK